MATIPYSIDSMFLQEVRDAVLLFTRKYCAAWASADDCEDLTQEAMITAYQRIQDGKLTTLTSKPSTYVNGIVKNLAGKKAQEQSHLADEIPAEGDSDDIVDPVDIAIAQNAIKRWQKADQDQSQEEVEDAVRSLVENMDEPCKSILWAYYWEGKDMREIAKENNYRSKDVAKSQKSRCMTKVKVAMTEIRNQLRS